MSTTTNFTVRRCITNIFNENDEEKQGHHFELPLVFYISMQFLAPGGLSARCVQVSVM